MPDIRITRWSATHALDAEAWKSRFGERYRRVDPFVQLAQQAASEVLDDADVDPTRTGVFLGTGLANLPALVPLMASIHHPTRPRCSPLKYAGSVGNAPAFYIAQAFGLEGHNVTLSQEELSFEAALLEAWVALRTGRVDTALVGALDVPHNDADASQRQRLGATDIPGELSSGASFFLLGPEGPFRLDDVRVGRFDPLEGLPERARVLRSWRAQRLIVPGPHEAPPTETRLGPSVSGRRLAEALDDGPTLPVVHLQATVEGFWGRMVVSPLGIRG